MASPTTLYILVRLPKISPSNGTVDNNAVTYTNTDLELLAATSNTSDDGNHFSSKIWNTFDLVSVVITAILSIV